MNERTKYQDHTLVFPIRENEVLLGYKKTGLGQGRWNGFGGKVEPGESFRDAALRELHEESGLNATEITQTGILILHYPHIDTYIRAHVFYSHKFSGEYFETNEMRPKWFNISNLPFESMWPDDKLWLPLMFEGKKFDAQFTFQDFNTIVDYSIEEML